MEDTYFEKLFYKSGPTLRTLIQEITADPDISADSLIKMLADWYRYPSSYKADQNYILTYEDAYYGNILCAYMSPKHIAPTEPVSGSIVLN